MEVGDQVREISTGSIGVIEKGNNSNGYFVNFGSRKNWKRNSEIEVINNTFSKTTTTPKFNSQTKPSQPSQPPLKKSPPSTLNRPVVPSSNSNTSNNNVPKVQSEDPGPRFGNFKFNNTQTLSSSPKYSTLPSKAFFDVSTPTSKPSASPVSKPNRSPIPDFQNPPSSVVSNNNNIKSPRQLPTPQASSPNPASNTSNTTQISPISTPPPAKTSSPPIQNNSSPPSSQPQTNKIQTQTNPITNNTNNNTSNTPIDVPDMWNIKFEELEFEHVIGCGKYGEVSLGKWLGAPVAIKKLLEETNPVIERELQILKDIRHPQIVQFLGVSKNKDEPETYIITEFMDGGDLFDALIFGDVPLTWKEKLRVSLDIAMSCRYLQARGILHRDLKSQNILLSSNRRAKLCDLGLARVFDDRINKRLTYVGSDRWMAPEISMGEDYNYKVDVFSFGIVLVEIITGGVPDERSPMNRYQFDMVSFLKKVPRECPPNFAKLCCDCTMTDPKKRPSFLEILKEISEIYESIPDDEEEEYQDE